MNVREVLRKRRSTGRPAFPVGRPFPKFPLLTEMTFGLQGIFVLAGATGIGKSTLAAHLAADVVGEDFPGVYYESENTFMVDGAVDSFLFSRIDHAYGDDPRLEYLTHTTDFDKAKAMLQQHAKGFLVVDTIQGSLALEDHDGRLDAGVLHALERKSKELIALADAGYAVLVVSQVNDRNAKRPPSLGALKGASALEQMAWTVVAYGTHGKAIDTRALALRKLRRPVAPDWPVDSRLLIRTDGQDGLSETGRAVEAAKPRPMTTAERVAQARQAHPEASAREIARLTGVAKSYVARLLRVSPKASPGDSEGTPEGPPVLDAEARS